MNPIYENLRIHKCLINKKKYMSEKYSDYKSELFIFKSEVV